MQRFLVIFTFYRLFAACSFVVNIVLAFFKSDYVPAIATKVFLTIFAWYYMNQTAEKRRLVFYKNLGISPQYLFVYMFVIDVVLTLIFLAIFKEFT